jgi:hypothetical protein
MRRVDGTIAVLLGGGRLIGGWLTSAHRCALQLQAVSIVNETIQDGVSQCWITGGGRRARVS